MPAIIFHRRQDDIDISGVDIVLVERHCLEQRVSGLAASAQKGTGVNAVNRAQCQLRVGVHT